MATCNFRGSSARVSKHYGERYIVHENSPTYSVLPEELNAD